MECSRTFTNDLHYLAIVANNYIYNKHTDWNSFRDLVETKLDLNICLKTPDDIEDAALNFFHIIQEACWMCTPYHVTTQKNKPVPQEIRAKILEKRKLRRIWQTSRHPADKSKLNKAIVELKQIIQNCSNELLQTQLEGLSATKSTNYSLWKVTKQHDRPQKSKPPLKHSTLGWVRSSQEKAEAFAKHLAVVFTPNAASSDSEDKDINLVMSQDFQLDMPLKHTSPKEIVQQIYRLENGKSPGFDKIDKKILTELPRKGIIYLTALFNAVIRTGYFPSVWKIAEITMIHKDGKPPNEITSYRPISLLPVVSKLFEKVILRRITPVLTERSVIPKHQFGFRKQHATTEQVHRVCSTIRCALEEKEYCAAAFLDVQQAFDRVWHTGLLCKIKMLLPHSFFHIIKSYIEDRIFYVKEEDSMSQFYEINAGVPQGSVLGPILYSIFTSDLPQSKGVTTATYADDTAILASNKIPEKASLNLQESLNDIHKWLEKWRIRASATKSVQITFTLRKGNCPPVKLGETELPHHDTVKYLGMHLDRRLTWQKHLKTKRDEINLKYRNLNWLLGRNSRLSVENKLLVYKTVLKPVWSYGIQLWGSAAISNVNIIQRVQNAILRAIGKAPWFIRISELHEHLGIPTGILGLAYPAIGARGTDNTVTPWLKSLDEKAGRTMSFSVKLCGPPSPVVTTHYGQFEILDDVSKNKNQNRTFFTNILRERWFEIGLLSIRVLHSKKSSPKDAMASVILPLNETIKSNYDIMDGPIGKECRLLNAQKSIVDCGTTNIRVPGDIYNKIVGEIEEAAKNANILILNEFWYHGETACWPEPRHFSLPWLAVDILDADNDQQYFTVEYPPEIYMRLMSSHSGDGTMSEYCYKLGIESGDTAVLGAVAFEGLQVLFNKEAGKIGFQTSNCGPQTRITGPHNASQPLSKLCNLATPKKHYTAVETKIAQWALAVALTVSMGLMFYLLAPCVRSSLVKSLRRMPTQISLSRTALVEEVA
ncbi:unnamed protein product [Plutella xylostella]|uniref:(diamondback moth) hypothetical protein n=1 Tax=Plutella xylostella TaxID=51655 RepID=A0A8S4GAG3_PLUXY|nr:unnamed protein product [Plutella xylostella]